MEQLERRVLFTAYGYRVLAGYHGSDAPRGTPTLDAAGNIYGLDNLGSGAGNAFELPKGSSTPIELATFSSNTAPESIVSDAAGNLFGFEDSGGAFNQGAIYEIAHGSGTITTIGSFSSGEPQNGIVVDKNDDVFGVSYDSSTGIVWEVVAGSNAVTTFATAPVGGGFTAISAVDNSGDVFCTGEYTPDGTNATAQCILEIPAGSDTAVVIGGFNGINGNNPVPGTVLDSNGNLFGATSGGGANGDGVIFEIVVGSNTVTALASFDGTNGASPTFQIVEDANGNLFGTTEKGGVNDNGDDYELPSGTSAIVPLLSFGEGDNSYPNGLFGGLAVDSGGDLVGFGSPHFSVPGSVYELSPGAGNAEQLAFATQPSTGTVGVALSPITVDVEDASGKLVTTDNSVITLAIASNQPASDLGGTINATAVNGVATFSGVTLAEMGAFNLKATDGGLIAGTSANIVISAATTPTGPASPIVPTLPSFGLPASAVAGGAINANVSVVVTNTGEKSTGVSTIEILLNIGTSLDGSQILVAKISKNLSLKTGQGKPINFRVKELPASLANGVYHLLAEVISPTGASSLVASSQTIDVAAAVRCPFGFGRGGFPEPDSGWQDWLIFGHRHQYGECGCGRRGRCRAQSFHRWSFSHCRKPRDGPSKCEAQTGPEQDIQTPF